MAKEFSFDIYSKIEMQEVSNAIDQAIKEITSRYDFKGSKSTVELNQKDHEIIFLGDDDYHLKALKEIVESKLVKRGVSLKALEYLKIEEASGGMKRQKAKIQSGIPQEKAKEIVKHIKNLKLKVQASIQGDIVRVSGKDKDELQSVIQALKQQDFGIFMQFGNYR